MKISRFLLSGIVISQLILSTSGAATPEDKAQGFDDDKLALELDIAAVALNAGGLAYIVVQENKLEKIVKSLNLKMDSAERQAIILEEKYQHTLGWYGNGDARPSDIEKLDNLAAKSKNIRIWASYPFIDGPNYTRIIETTNIADAKKALRAIDYSFDHPDKILVTYTDPIPPTVLKQIASLRAASSSYAEKINNIKNKIGSRNSKVLVAIGGAYVLSLLYFQYKTSFR